jgi:hypothetical protein
MPKPKGNNLDKQCVYIWNDTLSTWEAWDGAVTGGGGGGSGTQYADGAVRGTATGTLAMVDDGTNIQSVSGDSAGRINVNVNGTIPVSAAALPLPAGAATAALQTQPGVDIGDVTVNNAAGASAVNIQDGGNSITVDGAVTVSGTATVSQATGTNLHMVVDSGTVSTITNVVHVDDNAGSLTVDGTVAVSGTVATSEVAPTSITHGKQAVTTAGVRVQLGTNTCKAICVKALAANTGSIYVGGSTVSSANGFALAAGDSISLDISNTNVIYLDSSVNGEGVTWIANN